jgi:hypothetical protein
LALGAVALEGKLFGDCGIRIRPEDNDPEENDLVIRDLETKIVVKGLCLV